jgi:2-polyprenyl-3-methyl-5-hydroxy-6-metoxy-1,4-benzoquinol methylase
MKSSDRHWDKFGEAEPYYWVTTKNKYHGNSIDAENLKVFFAEGEEYRKNLFQTIRRRLSPDFAPGRILDFGCGVGRTLLPMAQNCDSAVGIDVAQAMLDKAIIHCREAGLDNVKFGLSDDALSQVDGSFDFIHSIYVFQHIPCKRGYKIFRQLLEKLSPGGVAMIQLTYDNDMSRSRNLIDWIKCHIPLTLKVVNLLHLRTPNAPMMEMHNYSINRLVRIVHELKGVKSYLHFTKEGPFRGVMMFIQLTTPDGEDFDALSESP